MNEIKLSNIVLDLKKVESADSIKDLLDYNFENKDYNHRVEIYNEELKTIDDHYLLIDEWLNCQNTLILRLERDILNYVKELY